MFFGNFSEILKLFTWWRCLKIVRTLAFYFILFILFAVFVRPRWHYTGWCIAHLARWINNSSAKAISVLLRSRKIPWPLRSWVNKYFVAPLKYLTFWIAGAHSEVGDGSGTVRGAFSYIDPRNQVRTVEYTADENGFHPQLSHENIPVQNTKAVDLATQRHLELYNKIAERNTNPNYVQSGAVPKDSAAVGELSRRFNFEHNMN